MFWSAYGELFSSQVVEPFVTNNQLEIKALPITTAKMQIPTVFNSPDSHSIAQKDVTNVTTVTTATTNPQIYSSTTQILVVKTPPMSRISVKVHVGPDESNLDDGNNFELPANNSDNDDYYQLTPKATNICPNGYRFKVTQYSIDKKRT